MFRYVEAIEADADRSRIGDWKIPVKMIVGDIEPDHALEAAHRRWDRSAQTIARQSPAPPHDFQHLINGYSSTILIRSANYTISFRSVDHNLYRT